MLIGLTLAACLTHRERVDWEIPLSLHKVVALIGFGPVIRLTILALKAGGYVVDLEFDFNS